MIIKKKTLLSVTLGVAFFIASAFVTVVSAEANPFAPGDATTFKTDMEKKTEGKCGEDMKKKEGKCGGDEGKKEGKCGGDEKKTEGKCGEDMKKKEGKCGGDEGKKEGKCGGDEKKEGKCS